MSHGDDLAYLFEARSLNGTLIAGMDDDFTQEDKKVKDIFTSIISSFARHGKITIDQKEVPSFSSESNHYMQINAKPKVTKNFRFCEMALWAGLTQRLQSSACSLLNVLDSQIKNAEFLLFDTVNTAGNQILNPLQNLGGTGQLGQGLQQTGDQLTQVIRNPLGGLISNKNQNQNSNNNNNRHHGIGIFGL